MNEENRRARHLSSILIRLSTLPSFRLGDYPTFYREAMDVLLPFLGASTISLWSLNVEETQLTLVHGATDQTSPPADSSLPLPQNGEWISILMQNGAVCAALLPERQGGMRPFVSCASFFLDILLVEGDKKLGVLSLEGFKAPLNLQRQDLWFGLSLGTMFSRAMTLQAEQAKHPYSNRVYNEHEIVLDFVPALIWYTSLDGTVLRVNQAMLETCGIEQMDIQGKKLAEVLPGYSQRYAEDNNLVLRHGLPVLGAMEEMETSSGATVWLKVDKIPHRNAEGQMVGMFTFAVDVTSLKETQKALNRYNEELEGKVRERTVELATEVRERQRTEVALRETADRYEQLFSTVSDPIIVYELETRRIIDVNEAAKRVYAYTREEFLGMKLTELQGRDLSNNPDIMLPKGYIPPAQGGFRVQKKKDGTCFPVTVAGGMFTLQEKAIGVAVIRDVTWELRTRFELQFARDQAEAATKLKSEFLANMSHEIRTPLNAIIGFSELLQKTRLNKRERGWLESINNSGMALLALINDILDLSKIEAGRMDLQLEALDLRGMIQEVRNIFQPKAEEKGLTVFIDVDESLPQALQMDSVRMRQILFNLWGNAVKFTESGFVRIEIKTFNPADGRIDVLLKVIDTGIGIDPSEWDLIFEAFRQQSGQSSRKYGGTGLGLSITRRLVTLMGGEIRIQSEKGKGSSFEVYLPEIGISKARAEMKLMTGEEVACRFSGQAVLVVDDEKSNRDLIRGLLEPRNLRVFVANDAEEAMQVAQKARPDLVLMDLRLPGENGEQAAGRLRQSLGYVPKIIAWTASHQQVLDHLATQGQFDDVLPKPCSLSAVLEAVRLHLQEHPKKIARVSPAQGNLGLSNASIVSKDHTDQLAGVYKRVSDTFVISDLEVFCNLLQEVSQLTAHESLSSYHHRLSYALEQFDIEAMQDLLGEFPRHLDLLQRENGNGS